MSEFAIIKRSLRGETKVNILDDCSWFPHAEHLNKVEDLPAMETYAVLRVNLDALKQRKVTL